MEMSPSNFDLIDWYPHLKNIVPGMTVTKDSVQHFCPIKRSLNGIILRFQSAEMYLTGQYLIFFM